VLSSEHNELKCAICKDPPEWHIDAIPLQSEFSRSQSIKENEPNKSCGICYSEFIGNEDTLILQCGHAYCEECIKGYLNYQISVGKV